jgi:hypothetical protein
VIYSVYHINFLVGYELVFFFFGKCAKKWHKTYTQAVPADVIFLPPLFMTFLVVIEVPEHDEAKKKGAQVSVCLSLQFLHF